ncbi:MAG: hypothetical protein P9L92_16520 [Candidatus Electryonea clarkiae]|nr:hypothetical protein [Candidatus Electryonea clarkiae]MDP8285511.1 hypothetical protein [Candidatus Electryonea clarkiae]
MIFFKRLNHIYCFEKFVRNKNIAHVIIIFTLISTSFAGGLIPKPHEIKNKEFLQREGLSVVDRGVGLLDRGQLTNMISNFGIISNFHFGTPAMHWPQDGEDVQQYSFGVGLLVLVDGELLSSTYDPSAAATNYTWEAADGSSGLYFNSQRNEENSTADGITPLLASSDRPATWPLANGIPYWPGLYRNDLENAGMIVEGEFTSDRDVYCVLKDTKGLDLRVEQIAYTYGRSYSEDFIFVRFLLHNDSPDDMNEVYAGINADLKPDFYADDRIGAWEIESYDNSPSFFFKQDLNGVAQRDDSSHFEDWVGGVGWIGAGMVVSPNDAGVTSFHYYHDDNSPVIDTSIAALMTNNPSGIENPGFYFQGDDSSFSDLSLQQDVDIDTLPGSEITFTFATGPFDIPAGGVEEFSVVFAIGEDSTDLDRTVNTAYFMAKEKSFQGSGPPSIPSLHATPSDGQVLLTWDKVAESSIDAITGEADFEGYRIYKSTDGGETWGAPLTNWFGDVIGYVPLYQCDLIDSIFGLDPAYSADFPGAHAWLGDDTGLSYKYVDEDVINGVEVWYSITAYDRGVYDSTNIEQSYETSRGLNPSDKNVVAIIPGTPATDASSGFIAGLQEINGAVADGSMEIEIIDQSLLTGHTYRIIFNEVITDTVIEDPDTTINSEMMLTLTDLDRDTTRFINMHNGNPFDYVDIPMTGIDMPAVDGFRIIAENIEGSGARQIGWTTVINEETGFDWWTENRRPGNQFSYEELIEGLDDWRVTITDTDVEFRTTVTGFGSSILDTTFLAPLQIEKTNYPDTDTWTDVTEHVLISDLAFYFGEIGSLSPLGWDLTPGGDSWNPSTDPDLGPLFTDALVLRDDEDDSTGSLVWLKTNNGPPDAIAPSVGDVFTLVTYKPFTEELVYEFTTYPPLTYDTVDLSKIKAVPNPFIVQSGLEQGENESRVMFTHLPTDCDITIYNVAGNELTKIRHRSTANEGYDYWDLRNQHGQDVAYGIYIYVVVTPGGDKHTGKLMVIR